MSLQDEKKIVLEMVSESKITVEEAEELLDALEESLYKDHQFSGDACGYVGDIECRIEGIGDLIEDAFDFEYIIDDLDNEMDDLDSKLDDLDATLEDLEVDLNDFEAEFEI